MSSNATVSLLLYLYEPAFGLNFNIFIASDKAYYQVLGQTSLGKQCRPIRLLIEEPSDWVYTVHNSIFISVSITLVLKPVQSNMRVLMKVVRPKPVDVLTRGPMVL